MSLARNVVPGVSRRSDYTLVGDKSALLIVDIQKYLSQPRKDAPPNPYFYHQASPKAIENIIKLAQAFRLVRDGGANSSSGGSNHKKGSEEHEAALSSSSARATSGYEVVFTYLQSATLDGRDISLDYKLSGPDLANIPRVSTDYDDIFLESLQPDPLHGKGDLLLPKTSCNVFLSTNIDYLLRNLGIEQLVVVGQLTDECVESAVRAASDTGYLVTVVHDACASTTAAKHAKGLDGVKGFARILSTEEVLHELVEGIIPAPTAAEGGDAASGPSVATAGHMNDEAVVAYLRRKGLHKAAKQLDMMFSIQGIAKGGGKKKNETEKRDENATTPPRTPPRRPKVKAKTSGSAQSPRKTTPKGEKAKLGASESSLKVDENLGQIKPVHKVKGGESESSLKVEDKLGQKKPVHKVKGGESESSLKVEDSLAQNKPAHKIKGGESSESSLKGDDNLGQNKPVHAKAGTTAPDPPTDDTKTADPPTAPKSPKGSKSEISPPPLIPMKSPKRSKSKSKVVDSSDTEPRVDQV